MEWYTVCIGIGEIGRPLYELLKGVCRTLPIDPIYYPENQGKIVDCDFMHVCIPGELEHFDKIVLDYIHRYEPDIVFIHSTVVPGTCRQIQNQTKVPILNSPVHGKHQDNQMKKDMLRYPKYVGMPEGFFESSVEDVVLKHLTAVGFGDIRIIEGTENSEWAKILSTTQFGLFVAWAQEVERICDEFDLDYEYVTDFFPIQEDSRGPIYPGFIGGHCVMPNIKLIKEIYSSKLLDWIEWSNSKKENRREQCYS